MLRPLIVVLISAVLGVAVFAPVAMAQRRGSGLGMRGAGGHFGFGHGARGAFGGRRHSAWFGSDAIFYGDPFYADYPDAPLTIPSQFVEAQPTVPAAPPETTAEPLMIELQGNRYVRFGGSQQSEERGANPASGYAETQANNGTRVPQQQTRAELPTVLIFRDGHREQIPEYAIVGSTLYASGDYWQSGQWTKNIQLSALDIPATVRANYDNGVNFMLPSAPNEVIAKF
jgi:hypothetical protein